LAPEAGEEVLHRLGVEVHGLVVAQRAARRQRRYSAEEWSWTMRQPSGSLRKMTVNNPLRSLPFFMARCHLPPATACSLRSGERVSSAKSRRPISAPGA